MSLKKGGLRGSLRNISTGASVIPDSAIDQFVGSGYSSADSTWYGEDGNLNLSSVGGPTEVASGLNGYDTVGLDGVGDYFNSSSNTGYNQPHTHFIVVRTDSPNNDEMIFDTTVNDDSVANYFYNVGSNNNMQIWGGSNFLGGGSTDSNWNIFTVVFDGANSQVRKNGTQIISGDAGSQNTDTIRYGNNRKDSDYLNGEFAEIVPCSTAVGSTTIQEQEQRLSSKYGISLA